MPATSGNNVIFAKSLKKPLFIIGKTEPNTVKTKMETNITKNIKVVPHLS